MPRSRTRRPDVESLEGKALLTSMAVASLASTLTATVQHASTGTQVNFTYIETNVSHQDVSVTLGPSNDGFVVSQNGKTVWNSSSGPQPEFLMLKVLQPGQSLTLQATWNGHSNLLDPSNGSTEGAKLSGTFTVDNSLDPNGNSSEFTISTVAMTHVKIEKPVHRPVKVG